MVNIKKLLAKFDRQKIKKIAHIVLETTISQMISNNFCKIGLNLEELELLECALVITFLTKIVSEGFSASFPLTFRMVHVNNTH